MPHTSHKKKLPSHRRKRQHLDAGDGWTTVVSSSLPKPPTSSANPTVEPATIPPGLTAERLNDEYLRYKKMWEESECCIRVLEGLKERGRGIGAVEGSVCLGLGSLTEGSSRRVGMLQLAVLETVIEAIPDLGPNSTRNIPIYAQDPVFNTLDTSFLSSRSIAVLLSPTALSYLTPATFLFAPHCERSFLLPALEGKDPEIVICNDLEASVMGCVHIMCGCAVYTEGDKLLTGFVGNRAMIGTVAEKERVIAGKFLRGRAGWRVPVWRGVEGVVNDLCVYFREEVI